MLFFVKMLPFQEKIKEKQQETQTILQQVEKLEKEMTQIHTKLNTIKSHMATFVAQIEKEDAIIRELNESVKKKTQEVEVHTNIKIWNDVQRIELIVIFYFQWRKTHKKQVEFVNGLRWQKIRNNYKQILKFWLLVLRKNKKGQF